ncbi:MAG: UbiX family flavin prenyltransferase [Acidobacteriota bacterium]
MSGKPRAVVVGVTGASGAVLASRLLQALVGAQDTQVHLVVSKHGRMMLAEEMGVEGTGERLLRGFAGEAAADRVRLHPADDVGACIASGSYPTCGMVIVPCSANTLGCLASGVTSNLIQRAADVTLKERRPLLLAFRETPLHEIHIQNMLRLARAGATIFPVAPAFYHLPKTLDDIIDQYVARLLDHLNVSHSIGVRWSGREAASRKS